MDSEEKNIDALLTASEIIHGKTDTDALEEIEETPLPEDQVPDFVAQTQPTPVEPVYIDPAEQHEFIQPALSPDTNWECKHCKEKAVRVCPNCAGTYCLGCASFIDPHYCKLCLSEGTIEVKTEELVDKDGVHHKGRKLVPIGEAYKTLPKIISEMTDQELAQHISKYKMLAHKHGLAKTFCEVTATLGEFEQQGREHIKRKKRALSSAVTQTTNGKVITASSSKTKSNGTMTKAQMAAALAGSGIKLEQLEELLRLKRQAEGK